MKFGAGFDDGLAQSHGILARRAAGLGLLSGRVHLHVDGEFGEGGVGLDGVAAGCVEKLRLLEGIHARYTEEVWDLAESLAVAYLIQQELDGSSKRLGVRSFEVGRTGLQAANEVPLDRPGQNLCLLRQLLGIVLTKVTLGYRLVVKGEDVIDRF